MQRKNTLKNNKIWSVILILYVILMSGSAYNAAFGSQLFTINSYLGLLTMAVALLWFLSYGKKYKLSEKAHGVGIFMFYLIFNAMFCLIYWEEYNQVHQYLANFSFFWISYLIVKIFDYENFVKYFIKVMTFLSVIALIIYYIGELRDVLPYIEAQIQDRQRLKIYLGIYNTIVDIEHRNCGIFWEPGMYQGFLATAILLLQLKDKFLKSDILKLTIFYISILTTYSSTGYALIFALLLMLIIKFINQKNTKIFISLSGYLLIGVFLLFGDSIITVFIEYLPSIITEKIINKETSFLTRQYSLVYDFILSIQHPMGVSRSQLNDMIYALSREYGVILDANTNTLGRAFVYLGIPGGLAYLWFWIKGCLGLTKDFLVNLIIFLIFMIIINTEPHLHTLFFNTLIFYWYNNASQNKMIKTQENTR